MPGAPPATPACSLRSCPASPAKARATIRRPRAPPHLAEPLRPAAAGAPQASPRPGPIPGHTSPPRRLRTPQAPRIWYVPRRQTPHQRRIDAMAARARAGGSSVRPRARGSPASRTSARPTSTGRCMPPIGASTPGFLVHESIHPRFVEGFVKAALRLRSATAGNRPRARGRSRTAGASRRCRCSSPTHRQGRQDRDRRQAHRKRGLSLRTHRADRCAARGAVHERGALRPGRAHRLTQADRRRRVRLKEGLGAATYRPNANELAHP